VLIDKTTFLESLSINKDWDKTLNYIVFFTFLFNVRFLSHLTLHCFELRGIVYGCKYIYIYTHVYLNDMPH